LSRAVEKPETQVIGWVRDSGGAFFCRALANGMVCVIGFAGKRRWGQPIVFVSKKSHESNQRLNHFNKRFLKE